MDLGWTSPPDISKPRLGAVPLDVLLMLSNDGFFFVGADACVASWSDSASSLSGLSSEDVSNQDVRELFVMGEKILGVPFDGTARDVRFALPLQDDTRWLRASVVGIDVPGTRGWLCSFGPERRYREIEQLKSELVAAVSHELKTPLASIKAYATTMRENGDMIAAQRDEFLQIIDNEADRLARAVDDLLLASRVDAEQLLRHRVPIMLDEVVDAALCVLMLDEELHPVVRNTQGIMLSGDPELLRDAFLHLLDNAAKFSAAGTPIRVDAAVSDQATVVRISDEGIGIAEEHVPYIFDRFYRVERDMTAAADGSGLGLFIAKALLRAHGGTIEVDSRPGSGSTFTLRLPLR